MMITKSFSTGRIRLATYDARGQQMEVTYDNQTVEAFKPVPEEVYRRLCNAPNPATYLEDRIAEEYSKVPPAKRTAASQARRKLDDLFGGS